MSHFHRNSIWQVELPDEWRVHVLCDDGAVIFRPDGVGKLNVIIRPDDGEPPRFDRRLHTKCSGQLDGFLFGIPGGRSNSRYWTLFCGKHVLLIRYSCAADHAGVEDEEVDLIVSSIARSDGTEQDQD
jgi:hypothetical protein